MSSLVAMLADAVTAELAAGSFSLPFAPQRCYRPRRELRELKELAVTVVPRSLTLTGGTRTTRNHDIAIDIAVQQKLTDGNDAAMEPLMQLVEELVTFLARRRLAATPTAALMEIANDPIYAVEHLDEQRVFTSVITATYRVMQ